MLFRSVSDGHLTALFRSTKGKLFRSDSLDDGVTWSDSCATQINNPNSAVDVASFKDIVALVHNTSGVNWGKRSELVVSLSEIHGNGFLTNEPIVLESSLRGSYSYPAIISTKDGFLVTYTNNRQTINFVKIRIKDGQGVVEQGCGPYAF